METNHSAFQAKADAIQKKREQVEAGAQLVESFREQLEGCMQWYGKLVLQLEEMENGTENRLGIGR